MPVLSTQLRTIFDTVKTIAVVGCSPNPYRTSNYIAKFLEERGYQIIPVNPGHKEILGKTCYARLEDIPTDTQVDLVNVFRNSIYTEALMEEVIDWKTKRGYAPIVWTQLDVSSPKAELLAAEQDIPYVKNKCIMVEWERLY